MHSVEAAFVLILSIWSLSKFTGYLEDQQYWTLRLRLSVIEHWLIIPPFLITCVLLAHVFCFQFPPSLYPFKFSIALICAVSTLSSVFGYILPIYHNRGYLLLRWKAWGGPSRTGIRADLVPYIGDRRDWKSLEAFAQGDNVMHPIDRFSRIFSSHALIVSDPTSLLLAQAAADQNNNTHWVPQSDTHRGLFQPIIPGEPAALLWGEYIGFQARCSRGILSIPRDILSPFPKLIGGVDARGLCLACGVLSRNKGLNPTSFICNLWTKHTTGAFEQHSVFWPRPAKTLRSLFRRECKHYFAGLGEVFVTVATELALLFTDAPREVTEDWLDAQLEHQDLDLNHEVYMLGAQPNELELLYRGHYAAMLASLSLHRVGIRIRPEMLVYDAVCKSMKIIPNSWVTTAEMENRRRREFEALGPRVIQLIEAVV